MITVKIRDILTAESAELGRVPFSELDALIGRLRQEGVSVTERDDMTYEIVTRWVVDETSNECYLEVIVGDEE